MAKKRILLYCFLTVAAEAIRPCDSFAYRPFISTDASVAEPNKLQLELGFFQFTHDKENTLDIPSLKFSYGVIKDWQFAAEADVQVYRQNHGGDFELIQPQLSVTKILRDGILQNKQGPSLAAEFDIDLPSTAKDGGEAGLGGIGIMSCEISDFLFHLNAGITATRPDFKPASIWGIIAEYPVNDKFRAVGELNGTGANANNDPAQTFGLIGFIWSIKKADYDFGFRKGLSDAAPDWELTAGVTFYF